jgi:hypothetical protein
MKRKNKRSGAEKPYILALRSLPNSFIDRDEVLLNAAFQVLVDFVENERPEKIIDWSSDREHKKAWKEISALYRWWKKNRPAREKRIENILRKFKPKSQIGRNLEYKDPKDKKRHAFLAMRRFREEQRAWREDQKQLHRLIDIRLYLWT